MFGHLTYAYHQMRQILDLRNWARHEDVSKEQASRVKWDIQFLGLAQHLSHWSKDPSTQVGAIIADENQEVVSLGYNGFPRGIEDTAERLNNRELKYPLTVHAEMNALVFAKRPVTDCSIYVYPFMPCLPCAVILMQAGISRVVAPATNNPRWAETFAESKARFAEKGVEVTLYDPAYIPICHAHNPPVE